MLKKGVTLRGIEVFEALAQTGSVAQAAVVTGLSQPAVSQQMRNLETAVGADLVDHGRRPMQLTTAGHLFLRRAGAALSELRLAQSEVTVMDLAHLDALSLGIIDDFDDDLTPRLGTILADSMPRSRFRMITAGSNELAKGVAEKSLHVAIAAKAETPSLGVVEYPLARDPFILVVPQDQVERPDILLGGTSKLPYLHHAEGQLIEVQINAHLTRAGITLPSRFEIGGHLALMAMVARGIGWTITTPLGYMRALRYFDGLRAHALPIEDAARHISLFAGADWSGPVPRNIAQTVRHLMQTHMISPTVAKLPWLADQLYLMEEET